MNPGRPALALETLLSDAGWVRRLAARLVSDPGTAEDLAQETLVAAWERPPAQGTPRRPWLARVLRNFARQRSRSEAARSARERSLARGPEAPDDLLERAELAQRLARAVLELDEPYRTTVLRRFFDGWSSEEIARAEGTNPSTVRTRLERGLAQLRERLERERGRDWLAALMPLVKVTGGVVVGTGTKVGLTLAAAVLCGWFFWPHAEPLAPALEPPAQEQARASTPLETSPTAERVAQAPEPSAPAQAAPVAAIPKTIDAHAIEGLVVRLHGESELPIEGAQVSLWPTGPEEAQRPPPLKTTRSQADGSFRFAGVATGSYVLRGQFRKGPWHETHAIVVERGAANPVKIVFGSTRIHGRVYDEQGEPQAGVPIRIDGGHEMQFTLRAETTSDAHGDYALEELPAGELFGLVTHDWQVEWPGRMLYLTLVDGDDFEFDIGEPRPLPHWRGTVRTGMGEPVKSGGTLHLERVQKSKLHSEAKTYREVLFDESARFEVLLEPASWYPGVSLQSRPDTRRMFDHVTIGKLDLEHDLVLPGTRLHGTVYDSVTLKPLAGYAGTLQISVRPAGTKHPGALQTVEIDDKAHFTIDMLEEGKWELSTFPLKVAAGGSKLEFSILPRETEQELDVQVQKP